MKRWIPMAYRLALLLLVINLLFGFTAAEGRADTTYSPIAYALEDQDKDFKPDHMGQEVKLKGTITFIREITSSDFQIFIQDDSGGIMIYCKEMPRDLAEGDLIEVQGIINQYKGAEEIVSPKTRRLGKGQELAAKTISTADLNSEKFYGQLVQIKGKIASIRSRAHEDFLLIDDGQNIATVYISKAQEDGIDVSAFKEKSIVSVTGIAFQYALNEPYNSGYEILPRRRGDVTVLKEPPLFELKQIAFILSCIALISAAALAWIYTLRKKVREKTKELESIQQQLIQAEKLSSIGQFVSGVAHELNNPLCIVSGYAQLLHTKVKDEEVLKELESIIDGANRASKIVKNLLTFARRRKPEKVYVNINELIEKTIELKARHLQVDNIEVALELDPKVPRAEVDVHQMQQVFLNIINNAQDAISKCKKKGRLIVRTKIVEDQIKIFFIDDGPGICKENLQKIFDPFFTTKEVGEGTGLGLSLSYGIMKEHGGSIQVQSEKGKGATFILELPACSQPPGHGYEKPPRPAVAENKEAEAKTILIVDDEQLVADFASTALSGKGYKVETCYQGKAALDRINRGRNYDLIITDLKMPDMSGRELYQRIKDINPQLTERMIFITGDTVNPETQAFLSEIGNKYVEKPFQLANLMGVIDRALEAT